MNIIDIVILVILAASVIYGLYRGFLRTVLSVACCLISLVVAIAFGPKLADAIGGSKAISSTLATYTDAVARVGDFQLAQTQVDQLSDGVIQKVLENVSLPKSIANILEGNLRSRSISGTSSTVNDYVKNTLIGVTISILSFILCFAGSYLIGSILISLIHHVFQLPILKQLDWLAGGAFGLIRGLLILYVVFLIVPILSTVIPMDTFNELLAQSALAPYFQKDTLFSWVIAGKF